MGINIKSYSGVNKKINKHGKFRKKLTRCSCEWDLKIQHEPWGDAAAERCCPGCAVRPGGRWVLNPGGWGTILLWGTLLRSQAEPWPLCYFRLGVWELLATGLISTLGRSPPLPSARDVFKVRGGVFTSSSIPFHMAWPVVGALWAYIKERMTGCGQPGPGQEWVGRRIRSVLGGSKDYLFKEKVLERMLGWESGSQVLKNSFVSSNNLLIQIPSPFPHLKNGIKVCIQSVQRG